jgi:nucleoside-diphosphate-sugar epimerase
VRADVFDAKSLTQAAKGCEVLIRAATNIPGKARLKPSDFAVNSRLRTEGTSALLTAARNVGAKVFLQESIVWVARPSNGAPFDEKSPVVPGPINDSMIAAEARAIEAESEGQMTATTLRFGNFYAPDAFHTRFMGERLLRRKLPLIGDGLPQVSLIHADDAARAFLAAAEKPRSGIFHVVDDRPASWKEFMVSLANLLSAPAPRHIPSWLARLAVGKYTTEFFTVPMRTANAKFKAAFGWAPTFPTFQEGLAQVIEKWHAEGYPPGRPASAHS